MTATTKAEALVAMFAFVLLSWLSWIEFAFAV